MFHQSVSNVLVAGHRGYSKKYPENTMLSFAKAIELGVDAIEMDINITADKQLIVMHDKTIDRTTNGTGAIQDMTLKELKSYDAGGWFAEEYRGEKIPAFTEFLELVSPHKNLLLNVEIKSKTFETVDLTIRELEKYNLLDRIVIACFDASIVKYAYQQYGVKTQGFPSAYMTNFEDDTYSCLYAAGINLKDVNKTLCDEFKKLNIDPWSYPADTEEQVIQSIEAGITMLTCNDPEPALRVLKEKGLHR